MAYRDLSAFISLTSKLIYYSPFLRHSVTAVLFRGYSQFSHTLTIYTVLILLFNILEILRLLAALVYLQVTQVQDTSLGQRAQTTRLASLILVSLILTTQLTHQQKRLL